MLSKSLYSHQGPFLLMFYRSHKTWLTSTNWSPREKTSASKYQIKNRSGRFLHYFYFYRLGTNLLSLSPFRTQCPTTRCQTEQTAHCFTNKPSKNSMCVRPLTLPGQNSPSPGSSPTNRFCTPLLSPCYKSVSLITTQNEMGSFGGDTMR